MLKSGCPIFDRRHIGACLNDLDWCRMDADRRLFDLTEFWLISAPGERTCQQTWDVMNSVTSKQANLSTNFKFHIPDLKVFCHL